VTATTTLARRLAAFGLGLALATGVALPAHAIGPTPPPGQSHGHDDTSSGTSGGSDSGDTATGQVDNCSIVSSPSYLGMACGSGGGSTLSVKDILGKDPVPDCWDEPLTAAELAAVGRENTPGPNGSTWYWERCLTGIDKDTLAIGPDGIGFKIGLVSIDNGDPVKTLTDNQQKLVKFEGADRQIPAPVAVVSPSRYPRVGANVSFFDGTDPEVTAAAGGLLLRARVTSFSVKPLGEADPTTVTCPGTGVRAEKGDTPASRPGGCWYKYLHSSADQPDQKYQVDTTAHWTVEYSRNGAAGPWTYFNGFDKSQVTTIPVTEIQALVVR
jgi:hypothetical protein